MAIGVELHSIHVYLVTYSYSGIMQSKVLTVRYSKAKPKRELSNMPSMVYNIPSSALERYSNACIFINVMDYVLINHCPCQIQL